MIGYTIRLHTPLRVIKQGSTCVTSITITIEYNRCMYGLESSQRIRLHIRVQLYGVKGLRDKYGNNYGDAFAECCCGCELVF